MSGTDEFFRDIQPVVDRTKLSQMLEVKCFTCRGDRDNNSPVVKNDAPTGLKLYCPGCDVVSTYYIHVVDGKVFIGEYAMPEEWRG